MSPSAYDNLLPAARSASQRLRGEVDNLITQVRILPLIVNNNNRNHPVRERDVEPLEQHEHVVPAENHRVERCSQQTPVSPEQDHAGDLRPGEAHRGLEEGPEGQGPPS